ncbi:hemolysin family protein [Deinococcus soli (ex Cha et al. 2016)]|uniref:CBS domain containing-hemolysin-like protein n=2 Tax=Deinococcus soli (ex Cha et al. 2016) TaxID=1309411 RepID=A0ACC6KGI1_9DEIO|nr:hemolysin family protein [Deinococcus soli (ex Cha et al. 2016)]MDR6219046.1 CBS domain containing-hemolysin-like protein [Deinococcus soli (ex Cha et al. 2016)]MDR6328843.1 CBS domain containing-hemolysin-like protein [Deinococcus soli (ex Cha et al. 2016)]MDR6751669.1 CBS domain containing-hemolysin-like protein [Deinococcus soli (ex Cha et al. 2016)]
MTELTGPITLGALVLLNGYFVAAEFALVSVRRTRIDERAAHGHAGAKLTQHVLKHLDRYIAATQLGITMASLGIGFAAEPAIHHLTQRPLANLGVPPEHLSGWSFGLAFGISTVLHIVFGELAPKSLALQRSEQVALAVTAPLIAFTTTFRPIIHLLNALGNGVVRLLGLKPEAGHHTAHSASEIRAIVTASSQEGVLEDDQEAMVNNVFDLSGTTARSIMTPRTDMLLISAETTLRAVLKLNGPHGYSRLPVYQDAPDNVIGVLYSADMWAHLDTLDTTLAADVCRPAYFVPEHVRAPDLLRNLKNRQSHLAIIVDEFGGTSGLITLEDLIEEIVGEIYDETDEPGAPRVQRLHDDTFLLDAATSLDETEDTLGVRFSAERASTLGGLITHRVGCIPEVGVTVTLGEWILRVEQADERRVVQVRASRQPLNE